MKVMAAVAATLVVAGCTRQGALSAPVTGAPVAPAAVQPVPKGLTTTLRYDPPLGSEMRFAIVTNVATGQKVMETQIKLTERVVKREQNRFTSEISLNAMTQNGATPPDVAGRIGKYKLTIVRDGQGKVIESTAVGGAGLIEPRSLESETSFALPSRPLSVGDTWTEVAKSDGKEIKKTFQFDSAGLLAGRDCVYFTEVDEAPDGTKLPPKAIAVDKKTGEFIKSVFDEQTARKGASPGFELRQEVLPGDPPAGDKPAAQKSP